MAAEIYQAVNRVLDSLTPQPVSRLSMFSVSTRFAADVPDMERAYLIAEEAKREADIIGVNWIGKIKRLHSDKIKQQFSNIEIQYFFVNEGCVCGVANEVMCRLALDIQKKSHDALFF